MSDTDLDIEQLKSEAADLGITHSAQIGAVKLKEKIDAYYTAQEDSGPAVQEAVAKAEEKEKIEAAVADTNKKEGGTRAERARVRFEKAKKTRIITVTDNDQRVNNHTTTCTVNCSNEFFDLGTRILPLNEKIEVAQGHINVLKRVQIPLHTRDSKTGLSVTKYRNRYAINYEDNQ